MHQKTGRLYELSLENRTESTNSNILIKYSLGKYNDEDWVVPA